MEWEIRADYDPGDETIHFGTRAYAESEGCIYEITTVATFQNEEEISTAPNFNFGLISNGRMCVCVGNTLTVLADETSSSVLFNMAFDAQIDTFTTSVDGNFLLVGLSNGFIQFLHIPSEGEPVYAKKLQVAAKHGCRFVKVIVDQNFPQDLLVVCASGDVMNIFNIDFSKLHSAIQDNDEDRMKEIVSQISSTPFCGASNIAPIRSVSTLKHNDQLVLFAAGEGIASLVTGWGSSSNVQEVAWQENPSASTLLKLESTSDNEFFVAVNAGGQLLSGCPSTLLMRRLLWRNPNAVVDFKLLGTSQAEAMIIAITSSDKQEQSYLSMLSYPDFEEKFSLPIGKISLLSSTICNVEDIHFLEFDCGRISKTSTISLKAATQTVPKFRLERLLMRKKFEAAESLAKNFGLSMTPVHIARVQCFLDQMRPWNQIKSHTPENNKELLKYILSELDEILDLDFVTNCCVSAVPPDYHTAYSLLEYAHSRLEIFFVNNPELESKVSECSEKVCGSMLRLETLNLLKSSWDVEDWLEFSHVDLLREVQTWIKKGALPEASVIWSRHKTSFDKASLGDELVVDCLLEDIPSWVSLDNILEWMAHLLPMLLEVQPNTLPKIVSWILTKISGLERSHTREWPKIGLDYCEKTLSLLTSQNFASPFVGVEASPLRPLVVLRSALASLHSLQSEYYIYLSLEDFIKEPSDVALLLLDSVDVGLLSTFITKYFNNYVLDHKLEGDDIISQYIMLILESSDGWWHWEEAPWESRISALIPHIINLKIRLQCIVATLGTAPVPWSPVISSLSEDGLKLKHPLVSQIREKQNQVGTNLILKKYGLKAHINKIDKKNLLKYIVQQNHLDMLSDLEKLAQNSVEDYITIIMQFFYFGNTSKALDVVKKLPQDMIVQICPLLIHQASLMLSKFTEYEIENQLEFISAIALCHEVAKESRPPGMSHIEDLENPRNLPLSLKELKNRFLLKRDFGRNLSVSEMASIACHHIVLKEIIQDILMEVIENENPGKRNARVYWRAVYAARLLMMPAAESLLELVEQALNCAEHDLAAYIVGCFDSLEGLPARVQKKLLSLPGLFFCKFVDVDAKEAVREASSKLYDVVSCVCSNCDSDTLQEAVEAFRWTMVWRHISGQQEMSLLGHRDAFHSWRFTPLYKDPGLAGLMNGSYLCHFLYSTFSMINSSADIQSLYISNLSDYVKKLQDDQHDVAIVMILSQVSSFSPRSSNMMSANLAAKINGTVAECFQALLTKVAGARPFDKYLGLGLLSYMGQSKALKLLEEMSRSAYVDFHRLKAFSCLGTIVTGIWKLSEQHNYFKQISMQSTWGLRLSELGFQAKELLRAKPDSDTILEKLIGSKTVKSSLLQSLCIDYQLDYQEVLLQHICSILLSWDPDPIISIKPDGTKDVIERNTQQQLLEQCWELQKSIKNKQTLCTTLASTWQKVNFYHHEVFIVILEILERHGIEDKSNKRLITTFLKRYRRVKPPDQAEEDFWAELFPSLFGLPPMSEFRLPFNRRLTDVPFQSISREINLDTYKRWLSIAPALEVPKDKICIKAVHQTVIEEFSNYQSNLEWCDSPKNEALIEAVAICVSQMDDVGQAAATLYFFMNKIPSGFDQVRVGNLCMQYAEIIIKETGETEYKQKIEKKYFHLATLQTLHVYGLGQPAYTQLVQNPTELIQCLYQHSSILDLCRGVASHSLDINAAVKDICEFHGMCLKTLHMNLVSEWLQPDIVVDCNTSLEDDSFSGMGLNSKKEISPSLNSCIADDNILRARYVMEYGDIQEWASFLISVVYGREASIAMRLRAMQCLCMLTDEETLEELSGRTMSCIRDKLRSLRYLRDLQILGLTYSESSFESCDKKELATVVLRAQTHNPRAVSFLVQLCKDYNVVNMSIWNSILQQLVDLSMIKELEQALSYTLAMYQLWTVPNFRRAWDFLLTSPFLKASYSSEDDKEAEMLHALVLFPTCPVIRYVDVNTSLDQCLTNQRPDIAALLLPYAEKSQILLWKEKILTMKEREAIIEDIRYITSGRSINVSKVLGILSDSSTC